jgi:hypothetical protein
MPNKKNLHIVDSYKIWDEFRMEYEIVKAAQNTYDVWQNKDIETLLNRSLKSMFKEWWLHNIGYYLTKPLCHIPFFKALNKRFKDVDLEEWQ